ncbi:glycosyltransferase [Parasphingorhabdus cellanae]|uniref:Glycosyltransferase n=1 Tax=Parasphingorhabdus cellanae TaxID=2806553 RepID=A0ABX7T163_9SPHN|nr:glycosyltransferase [Parasphingorhabdus cellanae]QTD55299.1 glycosyltransferase [Parasphingorhabdus cellanae]
MRPKILFIINSLTGGGAERVMAALLLHSKVYRDRYDMSLALLDDEPAAYEIPDWVTLHQLNCRGTLLQSIMQLRTLERSLRPAMTLSFLTRSNVANWASRAGTGRPWIISERVNTSAHLGTGLSGRLSRGLVRLSYRNATHVIAVSQGVADSLCDGFEVPSDIISVIANPVDTVHIARQALEKYPAHPDEPYIMAMGRLVENKNFSLLIDAFAASSITGKLIIIGDGPLRTDLERQIASHGLQERIILPGFVQNPFPLLAGAQFFVLSSNAEGFPNALVEAMSTGIAVVATNCRSGPSEILADKAALKIESMTLGNFGILVPCNNVIAMADSLRYLQEDDARERFARLALTRTKDYTPEKAAQRYWHVIEQGLHTA